LFTDNEGSEGASAHQLMWSDSVALPNKWIPPGGSTGGGGGGQGNFSDIYNTTTGATATQYNSLNGITTRAGEQFDTGSAMIGLGDTCAAGSQQGRADFNSSGRLDQSIFDKHGTIFQDCYIKSFQATCLSQHRCKIERYLQTIFRLPSTMVRRHNHES